MPSSIAAPRKELYIHQKSSTFRQKSPIFRQKSLLEERIFAIRTATSSLEPYIRHKSPLFRPPTLKSPQQKLHIRHKSPMSSKEPYNRQKSPIFRQIADLQGPKLQTNALRHRWSSQRVLYPPKEPYIQPNKPNIPFKVLYVPTKDPTKRALNQPKEPCIPPKEPYTPLKEPYIPLTGSNFKALHLPKEPYVRQKSLTSIKRALYSAK